MKTGLNAKVPKNSVQLLLFFHRRSILDGRFQKERKPNTRAARKNATIAVCSSRQMSKRRRERARTKKNPKNNRRKEEKEEEEESKEEQGRREKKRQSKTKQR